uniref:Uncharacterized protein n=1 Tax=Amphimedon queenslandica TaxID=400682 RepID=A0A1X7VFX2_AMPQE
MDELDISLSDIEISIPADSKISESGVNRTKEDKSKSEANKGKGEIIAEPAANSSEIRAELDVPNRANGQDGTETVSMLVQLKNSSESMTNLLVTSGSEPDLFKENGNEG